MSRKSKTDVVRKLITIHNFELVNGFVKDMAAGENSNDSAIIEGFLLKKILPDNAVAERYVRSIYSGGLKETYLLIMRDLSNSVPHKAVMERVLPLIRFALDIFNQQTIKGFDENYMYLLEGRFQENCTAVFDKIANESKDKELSFDEESLLQEDQRLLSMEIRDVTDFVPFNYFRLAISRWGMLCNNVFLYRMLHDVIALTEAELWDDPALRLRMRAIVVDVFREPWNARGEGIL